MQTWIVFAGIVVLGLAFMMWLGMFILSRGMNLNLETDAESRAIAMRQLIFGGILLAAVVGLGIYYSQMEREEILPEIGPGLNMSAPKVKEALGKTGQENAAPPVSGPTPNTGEAEGEKPLTDIAPDE